MGDESFDLCEYVWNHEMAMRRLLSLLRQTQSYCTDNECLNELPGNINTSDNYFFVVAICWFMLAVLLYFLRPKVFRQKKEEGKRRDGGPDSNGRSALPQY